MRQLSNYKIISADVNRDVKVDEKFMFQKNEISYRLKITNKSDYIRY